MRPTRPRTCRRAWSRGLEAVTFFDPQNFTWPFGTHIAIVEIDPDTGETKVLRYIAVDDVGNVINPMIVDGMVHGGVAQGIGQALQEQAIYSDNGQLLSGSMMDYAVPTAEDLPSYETDRTVTPTNVNPLGVKGAGETGTIACSPAIVNAAVDALSHLGVRHMDMPLTSEKVWRTISDARAAQTAVRRGPRRREDEQLITSIAAPFSYHSPSTVEEASRLLSRYKGNARTPGGWAQSIAADEAQACVSGGAYRPAARRRPVLHSGVRRRCGHRGHDHL